MTWGVTGTALAVTSIGTSIIGGSKAKKAAKKAAKQTAKLTREMRAEEIRQKRAAARQELGLATAGVYASNLQFSGTAKSYVDSLNTVNMREIAWAERAAQLEYDSIRKGGGGAGSALFAQGVSKALDFAASSFTNAAKTPTTDTSVSFGGAPNNPLATATPNYSYSSAPSGQMA